MGNNNRNIFSRSYAVLILCALLAAVYLQMFGSAEGRLYWLYIPVNLVFAFIVFSLFQSNVEKRTLGTFSKHFFSKDLWFHPSAINDYIFVILSTLIFIPVVDMIRLDAVIPMGLALMIMEILPLAPQEGEIGWGVIALYTLCHVVILDFCLFFAHYLLHKVPILWELHKVHHSAKVLTPLTALRIHPVELLFSGCIGMIGVGFVYGVFVYLYPALHSFITIFGASVATVVFNLLGANLRHSNIWFSYGPLENIIISPAQHHYHHSTKVKHFDKNMGIMFSVWDRMFGTLYKAGKYEDISFGLGLKKEQEPFDTVWGMYSYPVKRVFKMILGTQKAPKTLKARKEVGGETKSASE